MKRLLSVIIILSLIMPVFGNFAFAEGDQIIVHYKRENGDYDKWNLWVWPEGHEGGGYEFEYEDDFGKVAVINPPSTSDSYGFLVRLGEWEEKDFDSDRFFPMTNGKAEIWVTEGSEEFSTSAPDGYEPFNAPEPEVIDTSVISADEVAVRVHYHRFDENYDGWNMWLWPDGGDGNAYPFTGEDDFGVYMDTVVSKGDAEKLGLIVRLNEWEAKDVEEDRFIDLTANNMNEDGVLELFLVQNTAEVFVNKDDVDLSPKFLSAKVVSEDVIKFTTSAPFDVEAMKSSLKVLAFDGSENSITFFGVADQESTIAKEATVKLEKPLDLSVSYRLSAEGYEDLGLDMTSLFDTKGFDDLFYYDGDDLGAVISGNVTTFKLWAPTAVKIELDLYEDGDESASLRTIDLEKGEKGVFETTINENLDGFYYTYTVFTGSDDPSNAEEVVDPYARSAGVNGKRGLILDLDTTDPEGWDSDEGPRYDNANDAVVYEVHVRDVSTHESSGIDNKGKFLGLIEAGTTTADGTKTGLDHFKELGITHVQILPMFDYRSIDESALEDNMFNWGYDPMNYNAPEGSYSTDPYDGKVRVSEMKEMVKGLHDEGIGVIMDVVYNHTAQSADSDLNETVPGYYYRMSGDKFSNASGCGNETASERSMVRKFIIDSVSYWVSEYHIDGFRFDLMGVHDIETMNYLREELDSEFPGIILYGEGWTGGSSVLTEDKRAVKRNTYLLNNIGAFNDDFRDGIKGHVFEDEAPGFVNDGGTFEESVKFGVVGAIEHEGINYVSVNYSNAPYTSNPSQSVNYVSAHDNMTLYDKLKMTNPGDDEETLKDMVKLSNAIVLTSQGMPFLHFGVDFMRTKDSDHNSYKSSDEVNQIDWNLKTENMDVFNYYKGLIEMRKAHPAFSMNSAEEVNTHLTFLTEEHLSDDIVGYLINDYPGDMGAILVYYNANNEEVTLDLPFEGEFDVYVDGDAAGNTSLRKASGSITLSSNSAFVLMKEDAVSMTVTEPASEEPVSEDTENDGIGMGLGIAAAALAIGAGGFAVYRRKKK